METHLGRVLNPNSVQNNGATHSNHNKGLESKEQRKNKKI